MISSPLCRSKSGPGNTAAMYRLQTPFCLIPSTERKKRTETPSPSEDRSAHLRDYAARQKQATLDRLNQAITQLEQEKRPVTTFTIKGVSGLDYMAYYRNAEALALFRRHSTYLHKERQKKQAKRRRSRHKQLKQEEAIHEVQVEPRDRLLNYKKPELVAKLRAAQV